MQRNEPTSEYNETYHDDDRDGLNDSLLQQGNYRDEEEGSVKAYPVAARDKSIAFFCFFVFGAVTLLPWNALLVAGNYFAARLQGSSFEITFTNWDALTFTASGLLFFALANYTQASASMSRRFIMANSLVFLIIVVGALSTRKPELNPTGFFAGLITSCFVLAAAGSYSQNAVVVMASKLGGAYLGANLSGQGAIGLAVSILQFVSAYSAFKKHSEPEDSGNSTYSPTPGPILESAFSFFVAISVFTVFAILCHCVLARLSLYKNANIDVTSSANKSPVSILAVASKIRVLCFSMFFNFFVTLLIFPSTTVRIGSVHEGEGGSIFSEKALFIPLGFIAFNSGDWLGRSLPQIPKLVFTNPKHLCIASLSRIIFIFLFLMCNVQPRTTIPFFNSDIMFLLIMLLFSTSSGYISTLLFLSTVVHESLEEEEVEVAATLIAFCLMLGLAGGSLLSFML